MKHKFAFGLAAICLSNLTVQAQYLEPVSHVVVRDPRVFDLSTSASVYGLKDGPAASAELSIIHGPAGSLIASVVIRNNNFQTWGPIALSGKLSVKGTSPLSMRLAGGGKGLAKVRVIGNYDPLVKLMRVIVKVTTPEKLSYQWHDAFVPFNADKVGASLDIATTGTVNSKGVTKGAYTLTVPGNALSLATSFKPLINSGFKLKGKGLNLQGTYNIGSDSFSVFNSQLSVGYGTIFTPGSLVDVTTGSATLAY